MKTQFIAAILLINTTFVFCQKKVILDTTFSKDGKIRTKLDQRYASGEAVAVQPDGKIIIGGTSDNFIKYHIALCRYTKEGIPDKSFGNNGKVIDSVPDGGRITDMALQPDGQILVAGNASDDFLLMRYNADGTRDSSFGKRGDGVVLTNVYHDDAASGIVLQPDGKIVVAGTSAYAIDDIYLISYSVARYNSNGTLDRTFGGSGTVFTPAADGSCNGVALQSDGKIVLVGTTLLDYPLDGTGFGIVRFNADGSWDETFSQYGILVKTSFGSSYAVAEDVVIQPDGKIVVVGTAQIPTADIAIARYLSNGTLDSSFAGDGKKRIDLLSKNEWGHSVALQSNGNIVVGGETADSLYNTNFLFARFRPNGTLVDSLDSELGNDEWCYAIAFQPDGKLVAAGTQSSRRNDAFIVTRYTSEKEAMLLNATQKNNSVTLQSIRIYPTVVTEYLHIIGLNASRSVVLITDMSGKILQKETVSNYEYVFNASMLKPGVYNITIVENNTKRNFKFVKQ